MPTAYALGMTPITGVAVPIALPDRLARIRRRWDHAAALGARSHVTTLYPFTPVASLTPEHRRELAAIAARIQPFEVRFRHVRRWPGVVWIQPEPDDGFRALTKALVARWPDFLPYEGVHDEVIPHLTIAESETAALDAIESQVAAALPFSARATALELWRQDATERWYPHWRVPLGGRTPRG
jgi:2'-5' RNA ligase